MSATVVQITDLHLFAEPDGLLREMNTRESFAGVLDLVDRQHADFDCMVVSGDIAQDEIEPTYRVLRDLLGDRVERCRVLPGNHDDRGFLRSVFPEHFLEGNATLNWVHRVGGWKLVGLDSQVTGEVHGTIVGEQLEWLKRELAADTDPTLAFIHHPPVPIDVEWLDQIGFVTPEPLLETLRGAPHVQALASGHVHQEHAATIGPMPFFTTPSTCIQFGENRDDRMDPKHAGYRVFELSDVGFETWVYRVDGSHTHQVFQAAA